jgi:glycolate oxidase iron-sulfur subunit
MQTGFSSDRLTDPRIREANDILRSCVHCGFCLATCPTYLLLGDELDSPRGRIYLAKQILEQERGPTPIEVTHLDRCLTCRSCMTTCPSGVDYARLIDRARITGERLGRRPLARGLTRRMVATLATRPMALRLATLAGRLVRPFRSLATDRLRALLDAAPERLTPPSPIERPQVCRAEGHRRRRVALLTGCAQQVLRPQINEATVRILTRHGCEVVIAPGAGCCGAVVRHFGWEDEATRAARRNIAAWIGAAETGGLDAIVFNASACGLEIKDYGHLLQHDGEWAAAARRIAGLAREVGEILLELGLTAKAEAEGADGLVVAHHLACTMQHGLRLRTPGRTLLAAAGFRVREPAEGHICCGAAGTYSILEPKLSGRLRQRKLAHLDALLPDVIAADNIGCIDHLAKGTSVPVVHTVELLDWATGGPRPAGLGIRRP